jgi:hypothetical protein
MKKNKKYPGEEKNKEDFPGYPHYKQEDDMMSKSGKGERVDINPDETTGKIYPLEIPKQNKNNKETIRKRKMINETEDINFISGNEADVSAEEKIMLENEGELKDKIFSPSDLDVPGSELDDESEEIGSEDEENNYYSLGGDDKENLEENKSE